MVQAPCNPDLGLGLHHPCVTWRLHVADYYHWVLGLRTQKMEPLVYLSTDNSPVTDADEEVHYKP